MSETPETDAAERESIAAYIEVFGPNSTFPCDGYDHARKLERERDVARVHRDDWLDVTILQTRKLNNVREELQEAIQAKKDSSAERLDQVRNADLRAARAKRERNEAREQRDRLAEALERLEKTAGLPLLQDDPARVQARKALQSLTTNQP